MFLGPVMFVVLHTVRRMLLLLGMLLAFILMVAAPADARVPDAGDPDPKIAAVSRALVVFTPSWIGYADLPPSFDESEDEGPPFSRPPGFTETIELRAETGMCTGFFVTESGYLGTAAHCLDERQARFALQAELRQKLQERAGRMGDDTPRSSQSLPEIYDITTDRLELKQFDRNGGVLKEWREVSKRAVRPLDMGSDVAVLKLDDPPANIPYLTFAEKAPPFTGTFRAIGYPGSHISGLNQPFDPDAEASDVSIRDLIDDSDVRPTVTTGTLSGRPIIKGVELYETDTGMDPGMSGGPCLNEEGRVIGIISGGFASISGGEFNLCAPVEPLIAELRQLGALPASFLPETAPYDESGNKPAPDESEDASGMVHWVLVLIAGVAGLVIGALAGLFVSRRRKAARSVDPATSVPPTATKETPAGTT